MILIKPLKLLLACGLMHATSLTLRAYTVLIDFGGTAVTLNPGPENDPVRAWNHVTNEIGASASGTVSNLVSTTHQNTGWGLQMVTAFTGVNHVGTDGFANQPNNATMDSLYGNGKAHGTYFNVLPEFYITGLDPTKHYNFGVFGSRTGVSDQREALYTFTGAAVKSTTLDAANNTSTMAYVMNLAPDALGQIRMKMTVGPNNNNSAQYIYLNFLEIQQVPEPAPSLLMAVGLGGMILLRRRLL